jgi:hypothetical protein
MASIQAGMRVSVRDASGEWLRRRAVSGVEDGHDFPVVWVSREDEWAAAQEQGREPEAVPWPAEDVTMIDDGEEDENEAAFRVVRDATKDE